MDQAFLARGRAFLENRMRDTCRITRPSDEPRVKDGVKYVDPPPVTVYEGPCRIPKRSQGAEVTSAGDVAWTVSEFPLDLPVDGDGYQTDDEIVPGMTVEYLTAVDDPTLAGHVFGVVEVERLSQATARRLRVKEASGS